MQIFIDGRPAVLNSGYSLDIVRENWLFSGAETYSFEISFPMDDCIENIEIFGHISRADVHDGKAVYDCEIRDTALQLYGVLALTGISDSEVKGQFLEGRSVVNFDKTWDKIYINELDLGQPEGWSPAHITPVAAWEGKDGALLSTEVALPWVSGESGNMQNEPVYDSDHGVWSWAEGMTSFSCQPYLKTIFARICRAVGYEPDMYFWRGMYGRLLVCNTLPAAWDIPQYARALPHWTVKEFFEKLELFLGVQFIFHHRDKRVTVREILPASDAGIEYIDTPVDDFDADVDYEQSETQYRPMRNLQYKDCSHRMWKFYSCRWFVELYKKLGKVTEYDTLADLVAANREYLSRHYKFDNRGSRFQGILHARAEDVYLTVVPYDRTWEDRIVRPDLPEWLKGRWLYDSRLQILDDFGADIVDDDPDAQNDTVEFVPVWLDETDERGRCMFLDCGSWKESEVETGDFDTDTFWTPLPVMALERGESGGAEEYFDRIYLGYWDLTRQTGKLPYPKVYSYDIPDDASQILRNNFSFNLALRRRTSGADRIDTSRRYTFSFISDRMPDVRSLFIISGKRYICEKMTATFTEDGMSRLIKGVFHPVTDS